MKKITKTNLSSIKKEYAKNKNYTAVGRLFGITRQRVHQIITGYRTMIHKDGVKKTNCEMCYEVGKLEIHHRDRNIENNKSSNLITCCHKCHAIMEKESKEKFGTRTYKRKYGLINSKKTNQYIFKEKEKLIKRLAKNKWSVEDICILFNTEDEALIKGYIVYDRA